MKVNHKHLTADDIGLALAAGEAVDTALCSQCEQLLLEVETSLKIIKDSQMREASKSFDSLNKKIGSAEDFTAYLEGARERIASSPNHSQPLGRVVRFAPAIAAMALVIINYFYFDVRHFAQESLVTFDHSVSVSRPNLIWGTRTYSAIEIVSQSERVNLTTDVTTSTGLKIKTQKAQMTFGGTTRQQEITLQTGLLSIAFSKSENARRQVHLPSRRKVTITGTTVKFNLVNKEERVSVIEGQVVITMGEEQVTVNAGQSLARDGVLQTIAKEIKAKPTKRKLISHRRFTRQPASISKAQLRQLRRAYGPVYKVNLLLGGYFYGAKKKSTGNTITYYLPNERMVKISSNEISETSEVR